MQDIIRVHHSPRIGDKEISLLQEWSSKREKLPKYSYYIDLKFSAAVWAAWRFVSKWSIIGPDSVDLYESVQDFLFASVLYVFLPKGKKQVLRCVKDMWDEAIIPIHFSGEWIYLA